uniref:Ig-like domain-containing protein n=1 Tax=Oryzias melastigma TaxID=30732 RepID=A0A3B3DLZ1_ORYME
MKRLLLLLFLSHALSPVKHSLKFFLTGISGTTNFPEFVVTATLDDVVIGYCDSIIRTAEPKQDWIRKLVKENPQLLQEYSQKCLGYQQRLKAYMYLFKQRLNQTEGFHVLQRMSGCEWDEESGETKGFIGFGYDGEDFISLDFQTMTWITPKAQAVEIKRLWDTDIGRLAYIKNYYISECPKLIQKYMHHERKRKGRRPSVSLLQKTPSSPVSCHATGFYPERANLFWRKNGEEIHEDVKKGEILPNNDGTFQMSSELNISLVKHEDWRKYECVFQFYGVKEDIITTLNKTKIMTNWGKIINFIRHHVLVAVAAVVLLLVLGVLYCCWRKNL